MSLTNFNPQDRVVIALDVPARGDAEALVEKIGDAGSFYKIGYQLVYGREGLALARDLKAAGKKVFLDVKLHDIPNTVAKGIEAIADMGLDMVTVHAYPQTMRAAVEASRGSSLCVLGVTVLTSMDDSDLYAAGYGHEAVDLVRARARDAADAGMGGLVASALEAEMIRSEIGDDLALVTPGIRLAGGDAGDQKRVMTPGKAIASGASHLVVGRPISQADDPANAAKLVVSEVADAITQNYISNL